MIVKQFPLRKCGHERHPISAAKCLLSLVRGTNDEHYIIATQDYAVMAKLAARPSCPILSLKGNAVTLAKPSMASRDTAQAAVAQATEGTADEEVARVRELVSQELGSQAPVRKRKKKSGGPNPLSCKRKKNKKEETNERSREADPQSARKRLRQQRRHRNNRSAACLGKHFQRIITSVNKSAN